MSGTHRRQPSRTSRVRRDGAGRDGAGRDGARRLAAALVLLCVPVAAAVVALGLRDRADAAERHDRHQALLAARQIARDVLSYDYRSIDRDIARARSEATGLFARQYAQTATELAATARQTHAIVQATARRAGVVTADGGDVVVLLFVDQVSVKQVSAGTPTSRLDQSRVRMTLTKVNDHWRVSQLSAL